jgi:flagellar hook-associated protein 1 FlgK
MAGLGSALNIALQALQANQIGLAVASNNIANVNTPGYSRQRAVMQESPSVGDGIRVGTGVQVVGTQALRDQIIERRLWSETSSKSASDLTHQSLSDIETLFNESDNSGLQPLIANFFTSFQKLSTNPSSPELRMQVTSSAASLTQFMNARANDLQKMKSDVDHSIQNDVSSANALIGQIADTTKRIHEVEVAGQPANELRDQRTGLIKQLSEIINVRELDANGTYQLTTGNNRPLVLDGTEIPLDVSVSSSGQTSVLSGSTDITSEFSGGTLAARVAMRDDSIPKFAQSLDQMAYDLASQVNQLHSVSYDQDGNTGTNFFTPIASVTGAAQALQVNPTVAADSRKVAASSQASGAGNDAAIALGNLLNTPVPPRGSVIDQYQSLTFQIGNDTANADVEAGQHSSMVTQLENLRASVSGVSIDEETTSMLQFQRAYQASARVVTTVDELLQTTLGMFPA